jgi:flagellar hook capping protein FlgD
MRIRYATLYTTLLAFVLLPPAAFARPIERTRSFKKLEQLDASGRPSDRFRAEHPGVFGVATAGTTFYGGTYWAADSMRWEAFENQVWTFDTGVGSSMVPAGGPRDLSSPTSTWVNPYKTPGLHATMEGWIGFDNTYSEITYFRRLASTDPRWGAVKCVGSAGGLGGTYSCWCGVFPAEAAELCYTGGQGYGNAWNVCIQHEFDYPGGAVTLAFQYKNDTEDGFDYTHVYVEASSGDNVEVVSYTGKIAGSASLPLTQGIELPSIPQPITIKFCVASDGLYSDQDGLNPTACGAFAVDNITLSGAITHSATFEASDDGWTLAPPQPGPGGEWSDLRRLSDLPALLAPCACALSESVLTVADDHNGHNNYQDNLAASPWIDLKAYGKVGASGKIIKTNLYADLPLRNYIFVQFSAQWYPEKCLQTGKLYTSPWTGNGFVYYFGSVPTCTSTVPGTPGTQIDFSGFIPPGAEQVRIAIGCVSWCRFYANCTQLSNTTPWFDLAGLGVYGDPGVPILFSDATGRAQDNFPANGYSTGPGRIDCNDIQGATQPEVGTTLGDTLVVHWPGANSEVYVHFRVTPGPETDAAKFNAWYSSHAASPIDASFKRARCDTAEYGSSGPLSGTWMTAYHESDPNFSAHGANDRTLDATDYTPTGGQWRLSHDIFPDNLLTPGARVDYFFSANQVGSSVSAVDPPSAPAVPYEMEILPSSFAVDNTVNCVLYVNHFDGGARPYIENALGSVLGFGSSNKESTNWDRYDVNAPASGQASLGRPMQSDYGATTYHLLYWYRVILWDSGDLNAFNLTQEDADVLNPWLTLYAWDYNSLYLSGNNLVYNVMREAATEPSARHLVEDLAGVTLKSACASGAYRDADCPTAGAPQDFTPCVNLDPMPRPLVAGSGAGRSVNHLAQGNGCPELRSFDVLDAVTPDYGKSVPDEYYSSPVKLARFASVATVAAPSATLHFKIVTDGLSVSYRRDEGTPCDVHTGGTTAITERLREVLEYFGVANGACPARPTTGVADDDGARPRTLLSGLAPNPLVAGAKGRIHFSMAADGRATIEILDLQGRLVRSVLDGMAKKGENEVLWDGRDTAGSVVASGVYFYRFQALDQDQAKKIVIVNGGRN